MEKELDVVELENGIKMPVIDAINYQNRTFILVGILEEETNDINEDLYVYEKIENKVVPVQDNELLEKLIQNFEHRINNN